MNRYALSLKLAAVCLLAAPAAVFAHDPAAPAGPNLSSLHYGHAAVLGSSTVRTYVILGSTKDPATSRKPPVEMGVEILRGALLSMPNEDGVALMDFPIQARDTPIQYMMLDWNHAGHEPAGIYDQPHFDFHFYLQDIDEVAAIKPGPCSGLDCSDFQRAVMPLPALYSPQGYINVGSVVPQMGNHLIDPTSPEFNGKRFSRTFIYGAFDGRITFLEPMITLESILNTPNQCSDVKQPQQFAVSGYYPTKYCTSYDTEKQAHRILLKDFVYHVAPAK